MKRLLHIIFLSCKKATLLIEMGQKQKLSFVESLKLKIHLKLCDKCAQYKKQSFLIENVLKSNHINTSNFNNVTLSDDSKARFQKALEEKMKK